MSVTYQYLKHKLLEVVILMTRHKSKYKQTSRQYLIWVLKQFVAYTCIKHTFELLYRSPAKEWQVSWFVLGTTLNGTNTTVKRLQLGNIC